MLDFWPNPAWKYIRSKVMMFMPGRPKACSAQLLPTPDVLSGLVVSTTQSIKFGGYGEYICQNNSLVGLLEIVF